MYYTVAFGQSIIIVSKYNKQSNPYLFTHFNKKNVFQMTKECAWIQNKKKES